MAKHEYERMTLQDVIVGTRQADGEPFIIEDPLSEPRHAIGCKKCDKSLVECLQQPDCSGAPDEIPTWVSEP